MKGYSASGGHVYSSIDPNNLQRRRSGLQLTALSAPHNPDKQLPHLCGTLRRTFSLDKERQGVSMFFHVQFGQHELKRIASSSRRRVTTGLCPLYFSKSDCPASNGHSSLLHTHSVYFGKRTSKIESSLRWHDVDMMTQIALALHENHALLILHDLRKSKQKPPSQTWSRAAGSFPHDISTMAYFLRGLRP